jgi:hypothetical protein
MNRLNNTLRLNVFLAVFNDSVKCTRLACDRLTWVSDPEPSGASPVLEIVRSELLPVLNAKSTTRGKVLKAISETNEAIQRHFLQDFSIDCSFHLNFFLEEQNKGAFSALSERLKIGDEIAFLKSAPFTSGHASIELQPLEQTAHINAKTVTCENFDLRTRETAIHPGKSIDLEITTEMPVQCRQIRIYSGETLLLKHVQPHTLGANSTTGIRLQGIPVRHYGMLSETDPNELRAEIIMSGSDQPVALPNPLRFTGISLKQPPVSVFLDIGSSMSKMLVVAHALPPIETSVKAGTIAKDLVQQLNAAINGSAEHVTVEPPQATRAFAETYGIPQTPKRVLDQFSDSELAAHFANAISRLANRYYAREGRLLADVYWSFPNTHSRDFAAITQQINERLCGVILGTAHLRAESDSLRSAFAKVLNGLSACARDREEEAISAEERNKKAEEAIQSAKDDWNAHLAKPWYVRLLTTVTLQRPQDPKTLQLSVVPVPTLEPWQRDFLKLACDETLSEFLVFDAGGYSLDVLGVFTNKGFPGISQSFDAGSSRITETLARKLESQNPGRPLEEYLEQAEDSKISICENPADFERHPFHGDCRSATEAIYRDCVAHILDQVAAQPSLRGFPVILTGGGSRNQFLHELICRELQSRGLNTIAVHSLLLYSTLRKSDLATAAEVRLFLAMTSGFHLDEEMPRMGSSTDILGGMAQIALNA